MIVLAFLAQLAVADSLYASPALREVVARASARNRIVPPELRSYRARLESEIAVVARKADGTETVFSLEQIEGEVRWLRTGEYEQRITGYRSQYLGLSFSMLGFFRQAWTVPVLYGNRMSLFFGGRDTTRRRGLDRMTRRGMAPLLAIHPFATDRERVYRFRGGDTAQVLRVDGRAIPIVRIQVEPRLQSSSPPVVVFRGEVDVDAVRDQIVRMRGYFVTIGRRRGPLGGSRFVPVEAVAYVELENAELEGQYWLPSYQRVEAQAAFPTFSDSRSIVRIVSRLRDHRTNDTTFSVADSGGDTLRTTSHRLAFAPRDSLSRFDDWQTDLGKATSAVNADDFDDIAPDVWRRTGRPQFRLGAQRLSDFVHYTRVEGLFTGLGVTWKLRDAAPGLDIRAAGGWAWTEAAARGRVTAQWNRGRWTPQLRVSRALDLTNDFRNTLDSGATLGPLVWSVDDNDYVDRRQATLGVSQFIGAHRAILLYVESGAANDRYAMARLRNGPLITGDSGFRVNRGVTPGTYARTRATLELHPGSAAEFMRPGIGVLVQYERGDGDLDYQRAEVRVVGRKNVGAFSWAARLDLGALFSATPPPQQLFEIGQSQNLPGYDYKEFAGDRAVVGRALVMYNLGFAQAPIRVWRRYMLPGASPALSAGVQSGWTEASNAAARRAIRQLGFTSDSVLGIPGTDTSGAPLSRPTGRARTTVDLRLRLFGGAVGFGVARAVDHRAAWKLVLSFAQVL